MKTLNSHRYYAKEIRFQYIILLKPDVLFDQIVNLLVVVLS